MPAESSTQPSVLQVLQVRPLSGGTWLSCGPIGADVSWEVLQSELTPEGEVEPGERQSFEIRIQDMTATELDDLPEFDGW